MPVIDAQGRLFGRLNLVDALVVALLLLAGPLAYGAFLLFRDPEPRLIEVTPTTLTQGPDLRVEVHGENLRPYMRVSFGDRQGIGFLFASPTRAVVELPGLDPGTYDVVLYDYMQEVSRLPNALTIATPPPPKRIDVHASGMFTGLSPELAELVVPGAELPKGGPISTVLSVGAAEPGVARVRVSPSQTLALPAPDSLDKPATITLPCFIETGPDGALRCTLAGVVLAPDVHITLPGFDTNLTFRIGEIHYRESAAEAVVRVQFLANPALRPAVRAGDEDIAGRAFPAGRLARIVSVDAAASNASLIEATLRVPVERGRQAWTYKGQPVKLGSQIAFETWTYTMTGTIVGVRVEEPNGEAKEARP